MPSPTDAVRRIRVLIVEDSKTCAYVLAGRLRAHPTYADVTVATTLQDARDALAENVFDAVVLDLGVGRDDGAAILPLPCPVLIVTSQPNRAPTGYPVVVKGSGWVPAIESFVGALRAQDGRI